MRALAAAILVWAVCFAPLQAQERDRSLERIGVALQQSSPFVLGVSAVESPAPIRLGGGITLVTPVSRGEMVRIVIPVGEWVTQAFRSVAAANQRRQEAAARRRVEAALKAFVQR